MNIVVVEMRGRAKR